ncbi:hypothetical protein CW751_14445 [Brumimicrobium salinarum]|uniref:Uncharacterized protein n=1 Tax=Brumimicrobium salinarum TaxID=2058658 RepID=A0A2I0QYY7_9FLAO|nr:hypothetical protein [Brumimicrobium salinarum]PKR79546.1 hypothetical protein CW751_14445 [Brumimicrobium salinarum]
MTPQQNFINTEIWILTFGGAFQRASIYAKEINETKRKNFRDALIQFVEVNLLPKYSKTVHEEEHIENINSIITFSENYKEDILNGSKIRFGVAQKLLNLYLKYQWCLGNIQMPPHFPVDRIIQVKLKCKPIIPWTTMENDSDYRTIIERARGVADEKGVSLAEWELEEFSRRRIIKT